VAAALITLIVSSAPPSGVLAAPPSLAGLARLTGRDPAGATARDGNTSAPASGPFPSRTVVARAVVAVDSRGFVPLSALPPDSRALHARALDATVRGPGSTPAAFAPAAVADAPAPAMSAPRAVVQAAGRPARLWAQLRDRLTVTGLATWYPGTRGYAGISHVAMPGARYLSRGRTAPRALVCAGRRCTAVRVVDACACFVGTRRARVVDLSATALIRLRLDRRHGIYQVRVTLLAP
jgi:hypothetical protein